MMTAHFGMSHPAAAEAESVPRETSVGSETHWPSGLMKGAALDEAVIQDLAGEQVMIGKEAVERNLIEACRRLRTDQGAWSLYSWLRVLLYTAQSGELEGMISELRNLRATVRSMQDGDDPTNPKDGRLGSTGHREQD